MVIDDWTAFEYVECGSRIPSIPAVYFLMNDVELVYIGQTNNLNNRIDSHCSNLNCTLFLGSEKYEEDTFDGLFYFRVDYELERIEFEKMFIEEYQPKHNTTAPTKMYQLKKYQDFIESKKIKKKSSQPVYQISHPTTKEEYEIYKKERGLI